MFSSRTSFLFALVLFAVAVLPAEVLAGTRIAILGDFGENLAEIDTLTESLSKEPGVELVERTDIDKIITEQKLSLLGVTMDDAIKAGALLGAKGVIIIKSFEWGGKKVLSARLVAVESGAVLEAWTQDPEQRSDMATWGSTAASAFKPMLGKLDVSRANAIPVSLLNIRAAWGDETSLRVAGKLRLLMELRLMMEKEIFVLERRRLGSLKWEKELNASNDPFWTGAWILEGVIEKADPAKDEVELAVYMARPGLKKAEVIRKKGRLSDPLSLVNDLSPELIAKLGKVPEKGTLQGWAIEKEADLYAAEGIWAYRAGQFEAARYAADAALALGHKGATLAFVNIKALLGEIGEKAAFSVGTVGKFQIVARPNIPSELITKDRIERLMNAVQACKELVEGSPENADADDFFWGSSHNWRILCAEVLYCSGSVLLARPQPEELQTELAALRKLSRDFAWLVIAKGKDSDLLSPFLVTYVSYLHAFSDDPNVMFAEYEKILALDFPAAPEMHGKIRSPIFDNSSEGNMKERFMRTIKARPRETFDKEWNPFNERLNAWCAKKLASSRLSDRIDAYITRKEKSDIPEIIKIIRANLARMISGEDRSHDIEVLVTLLDKMGNLFQLGKDLPAEDLCNALRVANLEHIDLERISPLLFYPSKITQADYRKCLVSWQELKNRIMRETPVFYRNNSAMIGSIDDNFKRLSRFVSVGAEEAAQVDRAQISLTLSRQIPLFAAEPGAKVPPPTHPQLFQIERFYYQDSCLFVNGQLLAPTEESGSYWNRMAAPVLCRIDTATEEMRVFHPPIQTVRYLESYHQPGLFIPTREALYFVTEAGLLMKCDWDDRWQNVLDIKLKDPTAGAHVGQSLFIAFGRPSGGMWRRGVPDAGWRSDVVEIPDGSKEVKLFVSNTRRPQVALFDDCRPYEIRHLFGSPDGKTLYLAPYSPPCYRLYACDPKNQQDWKWKLALHFHQGVSSIIRDNPYEGGIFFACTCGHVGYDLNFSKGPETTEVFEMTRSSSLASPPTNEKSSLKWQMHPIGKPAVGWPNWSVPFFASNGKDLVFLTRDARSLLVFKEGVPGPYTLSLKRDAKIEAAEKETRILYFDAALALSPEKLFIYDSTYPKNDMYSNAPRVWIVEWREILKKLGDSASSPVMRVSKPLFPDSSTVTLSAANGENILYSVNSVFDLRSAIPYAGPFQVSESSQITAVAVKPGTDIQSLPEVQDCFRLLLVAAVTLQNPKPGLAYTVWMGEWESLPIFDKITPAKRGSTANLDMTSLGLKKFCAVRFSGYIRVASDGLYTFEVSAKDKFRLRLHGEDMLAGSFPWIGNWFQFCVNLQAGLHPIEIECTQDMDAAALKLNWRGPGLEKADVPDTAFFVDGSAVDSNQKDRN